MAGPVRRRAEARPTRTHDTLCTHSFLPPLLRPFLLSAVCCLLPLSHSVHPVYPVEGCRKGARPPDPEFRVPNPEQEPTMELNMVGAYGAIPGEATQANGPGALSYRREEFTEVNAWRDRAAPRRHWSVSRCRERWHATHGGDRTARGGRGRGRIPALALPYGPATEGRFPEAGGRLGPAAGRGRPARSRWHEVLRPAQDSEDGRPNHPMFVEYREDYYGGVAWANELAKRGYAVLCHDTFPFGSAGSAWPTCRSNCAGSRGSRCRTRPARRRPSPWMTCGPTTTGRANTRASGGRVCPARAPPGPPSSSPTTCAGWTC